MEEDPIAIIEAQPGHFLAEPGWADGNIVALCLFWIIAWVIEWRKSAA